MKNPLTNHYLYEARTIARRMLAVGASEMIVEYFDYWEPNEDVVVVLGSMAEHVLQKYMSELEFDLCTAAEILSDLRDFTVDFRTLELPDDPVPATIILALKTLEAAARNQYQKLFKKIDEDEELKLLKENYKTLQETIPSSGKEIDLNRASMNMALLAGQLRLTLIGEWFSLDTTE